MQRFVHAFGSYVSGVAAIDYSSFVYRDDYLTELAQSWAKWKLENDSNPRFGALAAESFTSVYGFPPSKLNESQFISEDVLSIAVKSAQALHKLNSVALTSPVQTLPFNPGSFQMTSGKDLNLVELDLRLKPTPIMSPDQEFKLFGTTTVNSGISKTNTITAPAMVNNTILGTNTPVPTEKLLGASQPANNGNPLFLLLVAGAFLLMSVE